jgi:hypothetical protein
MKRFKTLAEQREYNRIRGAKDRARHPDRHRKSQREWQRKYRTTSEGKARYAKLAKQYVADGRAAAKMREYRARDPEKYRAVEARAERRLAHRNWRLIRVFGITLEDYERMLLAQNGVCAICRQPERIKNRSLAVDHCHVSGRVRGLLCSRCNSGIGHLGDDPARLRAGADYLERHS